MAMPDYARDVKNALAADWAVAHPLWVATLEVPVDYRPAADRPVLLVAPDPGPPLFVGAWTARRSPRRPVLRLTGFGLGRSASLEVVNAAADFVVANKPGGISRVEDVSEPLITRDRDTGADLASITMPVIVRSV